MVISGAGVPATVAFIVCALLGAALASAFAEAAVYFSGFTIGGFIGYAIYRVWLMPTAASEGTGDLVMVPHRCAKTFFRYWDVYFRRQCIFNTIWRS